MGGCGLLLHVLHPKCSRLDSESFFVVLGEAWMADNWQNADDDDASSIGKAQCLESSLGFMRESKVRGGTSCRAAALWGFQKFKKAKTGRAYLFGRPSKQRQWEVIGRWELLVINHLNTAQTKSSKRGNVELDRRQSIGSFSDQCLLRRGTMVSCVSWEHMCELRGANGPVYVSLSHTQTELGLLLQ